MLNKFLYMKVIQILDFIQMAIPLFQVEDLKILCQNNIYLCVM